MRKISLFETELEERPLMLLVVCGELLFAANACEGPCKGRVGGLPSLVKWFPTLVCKCYCPQNHTDVWFWGEL